MLFINSPHITKSYIKKQGFRGDRNMSEICLNISQKKWSVCQWWWPQPSACWVCPTLLMMRTEWICMHLKSGRGTSVKWLRPLGSEDGFGCHIDNKKGQYENFTQNFTVFQYVSNEAVNDDDTDNPLYFFVYIMVFSVGKLVSMLLLGGTTSLVLVTIYRYTSTNCHVAESLIHLKMLWVKVRCPYW